MRRREFPPAHAAIPNLAPMVDVVMVILIFFMLGTSFAVSEGILPTSLPSQIGPGGGAGVAIIPTVRISLRRPPGGLGCDIRIMGHRLSENTFAALAQYLKTKRRAGVDAASPILIGADPQIQYQYVIRAMDACIRAGFGNIQFSIGSGATTTVTPREAQ